MLKSILTFGGFTMMSRILGFVRDVLMARILGAGLVADCFFVAFKTPNFFRRLFAEGAFNAAFVPMFSATLEGGGDAEAGKRAAREFAEQILAVLLLTLFVLFAVLEMLMPFAMILFAPGFLSDPARFDLATELTRITFPYLLFISLVSLYSGMLNALLRFAASAATPVLLNIALIGALIWLAPYTETAGHALSYGVAAAGALQMAWLAVSAARAGMSLRLRWPKPSPQVKAFLKLMAPAAIGAGAVQINLMMDIVLASFLPAGSLSYLYYADRLNELPVGVIGVAVGSVLLPYLSRQVASGAPEQAIASQNRAAETVLLFTLPAAAALIVIPEPLIRVLFEGGEFRASDTAPTVAALIAFSLGLPAYVLIKVLTPGYYARHDTRTPVRYALISVAANFVMNVALMFPLKHVGLALSTALAAWLNVALLALTLYRRGHFLPDARLKQRFLRMIGATFIMCGGLWAATILLEPYLRGHSLHQILALASLVAVGLVLYAAAALVLGAARLSDLKALARGRA